MRPLAILLVFHLVALSVFAAAEEEDPLGDLPKDFRQWLERVEMLITDEEREYFLTLERDFRRNAFIEAFWDQRDPYDDTHFNELRQNWDDRAARALSEYGRIDDDRARVLLLNGEPVNSCRHPTKELEVWFYAASERVDRNFVLIFERPGRRAAYRIWEPGIPPLSTNRPRIADNTYTERCSEGTVEIAIDLIRQELDYWRLLREILEPPEPQSTEWVETFASRTAEIPEDASTFTAGLAFDYPGSHQQRTVVQGVVTVPKAELEESGSERDGVYQFLVTGEVVRGADPPGDELFEYFRFRFEIPVGEQETVPLVFQRYLRPGEYTVLAKVEDLFGRRYAGIEQAIEVPQVEDEGPASEVVRSELFQFLAEADAATARGERIVRILPPPGVVHTGLVRFKTLTVGDIDRVVFLLDDEPILTKNRPPFSVELDLGDLPGTHTLRATGFDSAGEQAATDEILLNPGGQRFRVRLVEPQKGRTYRNSLRAVADVQVPDGEELDRLELFLGEERVATLYQPPWVQPVVLPDEQLAYVRAVAYLDDGNSAEELVFFNTPDFFEEVEVQFVELYATVHDSSGRPVLGLGKDDFTVVEDGVQQQVRRFEWVSDLPIHAVLLIDVSSSMEESLETVAEAANAFVEQTVEKEDRASLITFTSQPNVDVRFTNDVAAVSAALEAMRAEGSTALYDSLVFALHYFHGIKGQKALLLLSDGKDEASSFDFDGALAYARRAGVTVYAIGLAEASLDRGARRVLRQLADETGGRSFFVDDVSELAAIYAEIQEELRAQYLIAYQSSSAKDPSEFRAVTVEVGGRELEVRTMSGYYP